MINDERSKSMSNNPNDYGILLNKDIKLHRMYFKQMVNLIGIWCEYRAPKKSKEHDLHGDLDTNYMVGEKVGVIFDQHPDQKTLKKMGWAAELQEGSSIIHCSYDTPGLEEGGIFIIPSGIDNAPGRAFRIISMSNIMIYPASVACEVALEYESTAQRNEVEDFSKDNFTVLVDNEEDD